MEISINQLAKETGLTVTHIGKLIERGILPEGRKDGRYRYLPEVEAKLILAGHEKHRDWKKGRSTAKTEAKPLSWEDLI